MKAKIHVTVYCPYGCGHVMHNTEAGKCVCKTPNCRGFEIVFLQPTIELVRDHLSPSPAKPEAAE